MTRVSIRGWFGVREKENKKIGKKGDATSDVGSVRGG